MRLLNLKLHNFMAHADTEVDFTILGSPVLIKGQNLDRISPKASNEAGKTTIFNAIDYCLFKKQRNFLRRHTTEGFAELTFLHQDSTFKAVKKFTPDDYTVELYKNGQLLTGQKSEFEKYMHDLLGIDRDMYEHTIYQTQNFSGAFGSAPKQLKTQFITDIMDIKEWESHHAVANDVGSTISDYKAKALTKKEMLEIQANQKRAELLKISEELTKQELIRKQTLLESKKQLLVMQSNTESLEVQKTNLTGALTSLNIKIISAQKKLDDNNAELLKYRNMYSDIQARQVTPIDENYKKNLLTNALDAEKTVAAKEQEMRTLSAQIEDAEKKKPIILSQPKCPFCRRDMDPSWKAELERHLEGEIAAMRNQYLEMGATYNNLLNMRSGVAAQVDSLNKQIKLYEDQVRTTKDVTDKISRYEGIAAVIIPELTANRSEADTIKLQLTDVEKLLSGSATSQASVIRGDMATIEREIETLRNTLASIESTKQFIASTESQITVLQGEIAKYIMAENIMKHASNITSINGMQKVLILSGLEDVTLIANSFLSPIKKGVYFQFEKAKKSTEGFKPVFDVLVVNQYKEVTELEECSGAEAGVINFALRMALSTLVANKYDFKYMIIDEGMKDMDEPYLEFIAQAIKNMSSQFQIFLVTHMSEFREEFSNILTIQKKDGVSKVLTR